MYAPYLFLELDDFVGTVNEKSVSPNLRGNMEKNSGGGEGRGAGKEEKVDMGNAVITLRT